MTATEAERAAVTVLLGREPRADFDVVVRRVDGAPVVIRNAPLLPDGTPMPTRYWLVDPTLSAAVARLEAEGGVRQASDEVDPEALAAAHRRYASARDAALPAHHRGPRPSGGVGGTARGVKCLHAHYANFLAADRDDPVGRWVGERVAEPRLSTAAPGDSPSGEEVPPPTTPGDDRR